MRLRRSFLFTVLTVFSLALASIAQDKPAPQQEPPAPKIDWQRGPTKADLGGVASILVPKGFEFTDGNGARKVMDVNHNPTNGQEVGCIVPAGNTDADSWIVMFEFEETGYIKDTEKEQPRCRQASQRHQGRN